MPLSAEGILKIAANKMSLPFNRTVFFCFVLSALVFSACRRESIPKGNLEQGQVALTFDDASIENWYNALPLLDSLNIKATFYVSHYHTFGKQQKVWLKEIEKRGHEIAFHTATHPDMAKEVAKKGLAATEEKEIRNDLKLMRDDGYTVTNFAYPFGSQTSQLNTCLLRTFKSVRALSNKQNYNKSLVKAAGEGKVYYGADIDNNSRIKEENIVSLLNDAQNFHDCLVLVGHQINNKEIKLQLGRDRLIKVAQWAADRNLRFITVNEIAK